MTISIIIPVYNVKDYLDRCVQSVLAQDCSNCEILLIDDGSTDGVSPLICDRYAAEHPSLIRVIHQKNGGLGDARNTGIEHSKGDYLLFLDSDDYVDADLLDQLRQVIDTDPCDIIDFDIAVDREGTISDVYRCPVADDQAFSLEGTPSFLLSGPSACRRLWAKKLFTESGIRFPARVWYEDLRTTLKLFALAKRIRALHKPLYYYFVRSGSITHNEKAERNGEILTAFEDVRLWYASQGLEKQYHDELCALCVDNVLYDASVRVLKIDPRNSLLPQLWDYTAAMYPDFRNNPYRKGFSLKKKIIYQLLLKKQYRLIQKIMK